MSKNVSIQFSPFTVIAEAESRPANGSTLNCLWMLFLKLELAVVFLSWTGWLRNQMKHIHRKSAHRSFTCTRPHSLMGLSKREWPSGKQSIFFIHISLRAGKTRKRGHVIRNPKMLHLLKCIGLMYKAYCNVPLRTQKRVRHARRAVTWKS